MPEKYADGQSGAATPTGSPIYSRGELEQFPDEAVGADKGGGLTPQSVIGALCATTPDSQRRQLIIEAEPLQFTNEQLAALRPLLREFIATFRESGDRTDQAAVASAVRKYVATMPLNEVSVAAFLLEAGGRSSPPIGVELEVVKMVVRKLTASIAAGPDFAPELAERLFEIARTYLSDRLLSREKYCATALNAVLGLALLRSDRFAECLAVVRSLRSRWFVEHLALRADEVAAELSDKYPKAMVAPQLANLSGLVAAAEPVASESIANAGRAT